MQAHFKTARAAVGRQLRSNSINAPALWRRRAGKTLSAAAALSLTLGGCSTVMEANRPDPIALEKYTIGERRIDVIASLGAPENVVKDGSNSCEIYKVYTKGVNKLGKGAIILGEAAADIFTLGLAEAVTTTGEAVTKNKKHTVLMCYSPDNTLASITDDGKLTDSAPGASATPVSTASSQPVASMKP